MKSVLKFVLGVILGLLLAAGVVLYLSGAWYEISRRRHFRRVLKTADLTAVTWGAIEAIRASGTNEPTYGGSGLTNLPKAIAALEPLSVSVYSNRLFISFQRGAEGFGLRVDDLGEFWEMSPYPRPGKDSIIVTIRKNPNTGEPVGPAGLRQPSRTDRN